MKTFIQNFIVNLVKMEHEVFPTQNALPFLAQPMPR